MRIRAIALATLLAALLASCGGDGDGGGSGGSDGSNSKPGITLDENAPDPEGVGCRDLGNGTALCGDPLQRFCMLHRHQAAFEEGCLGVPPIRNP